MFKNLNNVKFLKIEILLFDVESRKNIFIKKICRSEEGKCIHAKPNKDCVLLKCQMAYNNIKYMLLGPAKIELRHIDPFRMIIHDFLSHIEIEALTNRLKKKMLFETSKPLLVSPETGDKDITSPNT